MAPMDRREFFSGIAAGMAVTALKGARDSLGGRLATVSLDGWWVSRRIESSYWRVATRLYCVEQMPNGVGILCDSRRVYEPDSGAIYVQHSYFGARTSYDDSDEYRPNEGIDASIIAAAVEHIAAKYRNGSLPDILILGCDPPWPLDPACKEGHSRSLVQGEAITTHHGGNFTIRSS